MEKNLFIEKSNKKHNHKYIYDLLPQIILSNDIINIICPKHGKFKQKARYHLSGQGCKKCSVENLSKQKKLTTKEFIERANKVHNNYYDYSKTNYVDGRKKIIIICPEHGEFEQIAKLHLYGSKCKKCVHDSYKNDYKLTTKEFIERANKIHNNYYDYSKTNYKNNLSHITIICPKHGEFEQKPRDHIQGSGCVSCSKIVSRGEKNIIDFIKSLNILFNENDRNVLNGKELDIFLPNHNLAIEFDGLYYHSELFMNKDYHMNKTEECEKQGIQLLHIFEDEWINKSEIIKSIIKNKLNLCENRIYGRKCEIKEISDNKLVKEFLDNNHIQGFVGSKIKLGLFYNNELVSIMTFGKKRKIMGSLSKEGEYEMLRFCNKLDTTVIGGASKLLKYFINTYKPNEIISYANRRYSNGGLYKKLGMKYLGKTKPNYFYTKNLKRYSRVFFQKHKIKTLELIKKDTNKTEREIMKKNGYLRIHDSGNLKYVF